MKSDAINYLVQAQDAKVLHHHEGRGLLGGGNLSSHLQTDLDNLQGVGEDNLRATRLQEP